MAIILFLKDAFLGVGIVTGLWFIRVFSMIPLLLLTWLFAGVSIMRPATYLRPRWLRAWLRFYWQ